MYFWCRLKASQVSEITRNIFTEKTFLSEVHFCKERLGFFGPQIQSVEIQKKRQQKQINLLYSLFGQMTYYVCD